MNKLHPGAGLKRYTLKSYLPQAIAGALLGGVVGFGIGTEVAPLIGSYLVKPSAVILDPAAMLIGILIIALTALGGSALGIYVALWLAKRAR